MQRDHLDKGATTTLNAVYAFLVRREREYGCTCEGAPMVSEELENGSKKAVLAHYPDCPRLQALPSSN
jgi:hypothetical protein